jgi:Putative restriction endonuclease
MAVATDFTAPADLAPPLPVHRFTVDQYHRMIGAGVLTGDDRVELLEGWIVTKMPHNPRHDGVVSIVHRKLRAVLPAEWIVRIQSAITLADSEPEPDLAIARGPEERYLAAHPGSNDLALVIEVSDSTLESDRVNKARLYARARIAMYWIINLPEGKVEVRTRPRAGKAPAYHQRRDYAAGETVPLVIAGTVIGSIAVRDLLP